MKSCGWAPPGHCARQHSRFGLNWAESAVLPSWWIPRPSMQDFEKNIFWISEACSLTLRRSCWIVLQFYLKFSQRTVRGFYRVEWSADMIARHTCNTNRFLLNKFFSYLVLKEVLKDFYSINSIKSRFPCGKSYFSSEVLFEKCWLNIGVESYILWGFVGQEIQISYSLCYFRLVLFNFWLNIWSF